MDKMKRLMVGRYGVDQLNILFLAAALCLSVAAALTGSEVCSVLCWLPLVIYAYRAFSRKHISRYKENAAFMKLLEPFIFSVYIKAGRRKDRKHGYYECPCCQQTIRTARDRGIKTIACPVCKTEFQRKR